MTDLRITYDRDFLQFIVNTSSQYDETCRQLASVALEHMDDATNWREAWGKAEREAAKAEARVAELEQQVRWFVEQAADVRLDGYRELGQRAADAENARDAALAKVRELTNIVDSMQITIDTRGEQGRELESALSAERAAHNASMAELYDRARKAEAERDRLSRQLFEGQPDGADAATEALNAIAKLCGCEQWDYPGQLVRDVERLATLVADANLVLERVRALANGALRPERYDHTAADLAKDILAALASEGEK